MTTLNSLELLEFYADLGNTDIQDADSKVEGFYQQVTSGLAELAASPGGASLVQPTSDADALNHDVTALLDAASDVNWETLGKTVANDAYALHRDIAQLYVADSESAASIMSESGTGDTWFYWAQTAEPPYTPEVLLQGLRVASVPATGTYTFTWSIGQQCAHFGWGFEVELPFLNPRLYGYLATSSDVPEDPLEGSKSIYLLAGTLAIQTIITSDPSLDGSREDACAWRYSIDGPNSI